MKQTMGGTDRNQVARVLDWLDKNGYPLEMRVAQTFLAAGFSVQQGMLYTDPDTQKPREIDIIASRSRYFEGSFIGVRFVIECKRALESPWLLFTIPGSNLSAGGPSGQLVSEFDWVTERKLIAPEWTGSCELLNPCRQISYAVVESFRGEKNESNRAYSAAQAVSKCSHDTLKLDTHLFESDGNLSTNIVLPTILIDGELYECSLDSEFQPQLNLVSRGVLSWKRATESSWDMLIRVETFANCTTFATMAKQFADTVLQDDDRLRGLITAELTQRYKG